MIVNNHCVSTTCYSFISIIFSFFSFMSKKNGITKNIQDFFVKMYQHQIFFFQKKLQISISHGMENLMMHRKKKSLYRSIIKCGIVVEKIERNNGATLIRKLSIFLLVALSSLSSKPKSLSFLSAYFWFSVQLFLSFPLTFQRQLYPRDYQAFFISAHHIRSPLLSLLPQTFIYIHY